MDYTPEGQKCHILPDTLADPIVVVLLVIRHALLCDLSELEMHRWPAGEIVLWAAQSPLVAKVTQASCIAVASDCGGADPRSGSVPRPSVSKTNGISTEWAAPGRPPNCGERHANSYM
jgi:hypothetical protein